MKVWAHSRFSNRAGMSLDYRMILAVLIVLSNVAWGVTVRQVGGMDVGWMTGSMTMGRSFSVVNAAVYVGLWGTMLFPVVALVAGMFAGLIRSKRKRHYRLYPWGSSCRGTRCCGH